MAAPIEASEFAGTILHVDDQSAQRELMKGAFIKVFGYQREEDDTSFPDQMSASGVDFRSFSTSKEIGDYVSDDARLIAMLTVGAIVAIVDGELEPRGFGNSVHGSEVATNLRRRVSEVLPQLPGRTMADSLYVVSYSGRDQKFGDVNMDKLSTSSKRLMTDTIQPRLRRGPRA